MKKNINLKSILKTLLITFGGLILAGILIPFVYKDKVVLYLKENINKNLTATVEFSDADITIFSSFPSLRITIDSLSVTGRDTFEGIVLYKAPFTHIDINLGSLFGKNNTPEINRLHAISPEINIVVLDSLMANYLIQTTSDTSSTGFKLSLKSYGIEQGKLTYQDNSLHIYAVMENIFHEGKGDFTQDIFDLTTLTKAEKMYIKYEGTEYLKEANADLKADFNLDFLQNKYTLKDNNLRINDFDIQVDGYFQIMDADIFSDITFKTASESFKSFLSLVPGAYTKDFSNVKTSGYASVSGFVKGNYNGIKKHFPAFEFKCQINDGAARYPNMAQEIKNIHADINIKSSKSDLSDLSVHIPLIKLSVGNDPIEGKLLITKATSDQHITGYFKAKLNLANLKSAIPIENIEKLSGNIGCNLNFNAKIQDIVTQNYSKINFTGEGIGTSIHYKTKNHPNINIENTVLKASPALLSLQTNQMKFGKSDASASVEVHNPLAFLTQGNQLQTNIKMTSGYIDLNEWMQSTNTSKDTKATEMPISIINDDLIKNSGIHIDLKAEKVQFQDKTMEHINIKGTMAANAINIEDLSAQIKQSDIHMSGTLINVYDYLFNNNTLDGKIALYSNNLDVNQFFITPPTNNPADSATIIPVPDRMRIQIYTEIKTLTYTNLVLKNFKGTLEVKNNEVALKNLETNTLGGKLALEGLYNTTDLHKPDFAIKLDLSKIAFAEALSKIDMFKKVAPIAGYINGFFNTSLIMRGKLGGTMMPDLSTLDASGMLETLNGAIVGLSPMAELAQKIGIKELSEINLSNSKNWFEIIQGFIELKPFSTTIKGIDMTISGKHGFGKAMDYKINLTIPRALLKKNNLLNIAESGLSNIEKEAAKLGVNIHQGPQIFLDVIMTGSIKKPQFKIIPRNTVGSTYAEAVEEKADEIVKNIKDSIQAEIKKKEAELKDTITKRANEELEKLKNEASKVADKAIDSLKNVAQEQVFQRLDTLSKGVIPDSLKQKVNDILNKKSSDEVEKIKEKLKDFNPFKKKKENGF